MIESYLSTSPNLRGIVQLLDVRHDPTNDDLQMFDFLAKTGVPTMVVMTKTDKLSKAQAVIRIRAITASLGLEDDQVIPFSAETGEGREDLAESVMALVAASGSDNPPE
jgi:GTP-binding protein